MAALQAAEPLNLCSKGCGFVGSQATADMCSMCFKKAVLAGELSASAEDMEQAIHMKQAQERGDMEKLRLARLKEELLSNEHGANRVTDDEFYEMCERAGKVLAAGEVNPITIFTLLNGKRLLARQAYTIRAFLGIDYTSVEANTLYAFTADRWNLQRYNGTEGYYAITEDGEDICVMSELEPIPRQPLNINHHIEQSAERGARYQRARAAKGAAENNK